MSSGKREAWGSVIKLMDLVIAGDSVPKESHNQMESTVHEKCEEIISLHM
jgi:hypothetical protein